MIAQAVLQALRDAAYAADWVRDGQAAMHVLSQHEHDAVLLDLGLPRKDGEAVLRQLRKHGDTVPVVVMTARDAIADRIAMLDLGADDYLVKPFDINELLARLRAVGRRAAGQATGKLSHGLLTLDPARHVACFDGVECELSAREYALLEALVLRRGSIVSRSTLETALYGWNEEVESNAIEFLIHRVRKKLGASVIKNVRGVGWTLGNAQPHDR
ncbi:DNA-binding response regulator [Dyella flagellata]|uniref:DNA-binding response regulator n=2 Tax=Dyella flagellata TaxID=1867833 RepID=A0ABQ5X9P2_9GAMM|nr:DNA-binding response regulator [Dyella flagellata]